MLNNLIRWNTTSDRPEKRALFLRFGAESDERRAPVIGPVGMTLPRGLLEDFDEPQARVK